MLLSFLLKRKKKHLFVIINKMKFLINFLFALLLMLTSGTAWAVVPPITDDTGTPGPNNWQVGMALTADKERDHTRYETPVMEVDYGIGKNVGLKYQVAWITLHSEAQDTTKNGLDDQLIGVQWRFLDEEKIGAAMSFLPQVQFNSPNHSVERGIVPRERTIYLLTQIEKNIGDFDGVTEWGYLVNEKARNQWLYNIMFRYKLTKKLTAMAELNGGMVWDFTDQHYQFNAGFFYDINDNFQLFFTGGRGLVMQDGGPTMLLFLGTWVKF